MAAASTTSTSEFIELDLSASSTLLQSIESEFHIALASETEHATSSSSSFSAGTEKTMEGMERKNCSTSIEHQIEYSKRHWSQLAEPDSNLDEEGVAAEKVFKSLQMHKDWGYFFLTFGYHLVNWRASSGSMEHRFTTEETNRFIDEEGFFSCGKHRRDQMCNDCFHREVAIDNRECRLFGCDLGREVFRIWNELPVRKAVQVPWSQDEDEVDESPSVNVQRQSEKANPSSFVSGEKTCAHCGKGGNLNRCAKCKITFYCSRSHQAADYAKHKADYQAPKALVNDAAQPTTTRHKEKPYHAPDNSEKPPSSAWLICAHCGIKGDKLSRCARCRCSWYCSAEHQRGHYPEHKQECREIAETKKENALLWPSVPTDSFHPHIWANKTVCMMNLKNEDSMAREYRVISWRELERMHPNVATGRTLEIRIVSLEPVGFLAEECVGRDAEGSEREVAFRTYCPPESLRKGCVLRWRNPWSHHFVYGGFGSNIEHWDLPNVSISDG